MLKRALAGLSATGFLLIAAAAAYAQGPGMPGTAGGTPVGTRDLLQSVVSTVCFGLVGILIAIVGFKLFDLAIRANLEKEICENNNIAAAILAGAVVIGICIIVSFVLIAP